MDNWWATTLFSNTGPIKWLITRWWRPGGTPGPRRTHLRASPEGAVAWERRCKRGAKVRKLVTCDPEEWPDGSINYPHQFSGGWTPGGQIARRIFCPAIWPAWPGCGRKSRPSWRPTRCTPGSPMEIQSLVFRLINYRREVVIRPFTGRFRFH